MDTVVKATFTIIDDDSKAKRTEVIEMIYPMDEERNFVKSLISYLESDDDPMASEAPKIVTGH